MADNPFAVEKWADSAMFRAQERPDQGEEEAGFITPRVYLISMTPDPLGIIAAACMMYEGRVAYSLSDVTHEDRHKYFEQLLNTRLRAPFEFVQLHFLAENVPRSITHQMVRQRTATFVQESLRFAVKEHVDEDVSLPPSLRSLPADSPQRRVWAKTVNTIDDAYNALVSSGVPAEDARGLLPHNVVTRLHWSTDLKSLLEHAGNRLCTQAQFEWRLIFAGVAAAIRSYNPYAQAIQQADNLGERDGAMLMEFLAESDRWQYDKIASALAPICYATGRCEFKASFDRSCSIRERVDANEQIRRPSSQWHEGVQATGIGAEPDVFIDPIRPEEWLADPTAARRDG